MQKDHLIKAKTTHCKRKSPRSWNRRVLSQTEERIYKKSYVNIILNGGTLDYGEQGRDVLYHLSYSTS